MYQKDAARALDEFPAVLGSIVSVACTTTPQVIDLTTMPAMGSYPSGQVPLDSQNPVSHFVRIVPDAASGVSMYYATGSNFALLNAIANSAQSTTVNATTGALTISGKEVQLLPIGGAKVKIVATTSPQTENPPGKSSPCRYVVLFTGSSTGTARIHQCAE